VCVCVGGGISLMSMLLSQLVFQTGINILAPVGNTNRD
jgi:hypothetical protein